MAWADAATGAARTPATKETVQSVRTEKGRTVVPREDNDGEGLPVRTAGKTDQVYWDAALFTPAWRTIGGGGQGDLMAALHLAQAGRSGWPAGRGAIGWLGSAQGQQIRPQRGSNVVRLARYEPGQL